jgi:hypothetical protein
MNLHPGMATTQSVIKYYEAPEYGSKTPQLEKNARKRNRRIVSMRKDGDPYMLRGQSLNLNSQYSQNAEQDKLQ